MLKSVIFYSKVQKNSTSRLKKNIENSTKESNEYKVELNKENNKAKEVLSLKDCFIKKSVSKQRRASNEVTLNFPQKENLNKFKVIKNKKIQKNKNTSKIGKDQLKKKKKKYIFHIRRRYLKKMKDMKKFS